MDNIHPDMFQPHFLTGAYHGPPLPVPTTTAHLVQVQQQQQQVPQPQPPQHPPQIALPQLPLAAAVVNRTLHKEHKLPLPLPLQTPTHAVDGEQQDSKVRMCEVCQLGFASVQQLKRHQETVHSEHKPHKCEYCEKSFKRKDKMQHHEQYVHLGIRFPCEFCEKNFTRRDHLKRHTAQFHTDDASVKKFKCELCDFDSVRKDKLIRHVKIKHDLIKPSALTPNCWFPCEFCEKTFTRKDHMKRHVFRFHTEEGRNPVKLKCPQCDYQSVRKDKINKHIKMKHMPQEPVMIASPSGVPQLQLPPPQLNITPPPRFPCEFCEKSFTRKDHMKRHVFRFHTEEGRNQEKLKCPHCDYQSVQKYKLNKHIKTKHQQQSVVPQPPVTAAAPPTATAPPPTTQPPPQLNITAPLRVTEAAAAAAAELSKAWLQQEGPPTQIDARLYQPIPMHF